VVVGATATLTSAATGLTRTATTNQNGLFQFQQLPPGTYELRVEQQGFKTIVQTLHLLVNTPAALDFVMETGQIVELLEITGEALINKVDATVGNPFSEVQIRQLPLEARNVVGLLSLQAGAVFLPENPEVGRDFDTRSGSVNGSRSDQSNVTLDGVDVNDSQFGYAYTSVLRTTLDSVQEFRVTTTSYGADQGRSSGAQVSLVTKRGSNDIHGSLYWYHRNTVTSANEYFLKRSQLESGEPNEPPKLLRNIFGASAGGPIVKNRLFIFGNYEGRRDASEESVLRSVPSMLFRHGYLQYTCTDPAECPASTVTVGGRAFNVPAGVRALSPMELAAIDPLGIGPNTAAMAYLQQYPAPNDPGRDGLNIVGFRFAAPIKNKFDTYILRADFNIDRQGKHTLFWRGNLQDDVLDSVPQFPGQAPISRQLINNKGFALGYDAVLKSNLVNTFRWGLSRIQEEKAGLQTRSEVHFRFIDDFFPTAFFDNSDTSARRVPTHNIADNLSWTRGSHTLQTGLNFRFTRIPRFTNSNSFHRASTNASWLLGIGRTYVPGRASCDTPGCAAVPAVDPGFVASFGDSVVPLLGLITQVDSLYNYDREGNILPVGAPVTRRYASDEYEWYVQDRWQLTPDVTLTAGVRYSLFSPPWETNGLQVTPNMELGDWFDLRAANAARGLAANEAPPISFDLGGPANGRRGFYDWDKNNFAPRLAIAWSPHFRSGVLGRLLGDGKTVFRGGYSLVYDHIGQGIATTFDRAGSFGLSTELTNPSSVQTEASAPRFTNIFTVPSELLSPAPPGGFPQTPPLDLFAITTSIDGTIKTPYAHVYSFNIGRELPHDFSLELGYVGRGGRKLLIQRDLAMPVNLVDPQSGMDYFTAAQMFARFIEADMSVAAVGNNPIPYWENLFPGAVGAPFAGGCDIDGLGRPARNATEAMYDLYKCVAPDYTTGLLIFDLFGEPSFSRFGPFSYFDDQYSALASWSSIGTSEYHAFQLSLRKRFSAGTQFDFNYTLSKALDINSEAERVEEYGGLFTGGYSGFLINSFSPQLQYSFSDFDIRHQLNANWLTELPFGRGKALGSTAPGWANHIIGNWQVAGLFRWSSGLPANIINCRLCWATNWNVQGNAELATGRLPETGTTRNLPGGPNLFPNPSQARQAFRFQRPGEAGIRNLLRGDGYFSIDMGLGKAFRITESHRLQFRWEVFNVTNSVRFDVADVNATPDIESTFGQYNSILPGPRVMQFALRYEF
jgi:hypothetical protein